MTGDVDKQSGCLTGQMCWDCVLVGEGKVLGGARQKEQHVPFGYRLKKQRLEGSVSGTLGQPV